MMAKIWGKMWEDEIEPEGQRMKKGHGGPFRRHAMTFNPDPEPIRGSPSRLGWHWRYRPNPWRPLTRFFDFLRS
jgi:hypothetical protein